MRIPVLSMAYATNSCKVKNRHAAMAAPHKDHHDIMEVPWNFLQIPPHYEGMVAMVTTIDNTNTDVVLAENI